MNNQPAMTLLRKRLLPLLLAALILTGCLPVASGPTPTPTAMPAPPSTPTPTFTPTLTSTTILAAKRVLILSLDGFRPDAIGVAPMPNLQALMATGAYSLTAQTILPSATLPSHASMLTGFCPSKHGVDWNYYDLSLGYARGPSLFDLAHAAGLQTVMVVGKNKLVQVTDPAGVDSFTFIADRDVVITQTLLDNFPDDFGILFIHFPTPDDMGDTYGWMSWEYLNVLHQADEAIASILQTLDEKGLRGETLIIVTADHGGHDLSHYTDLPVDMTIPWIISGPGVVPGELTIPINTTDTAATAAWALGYDLPSEWDGIPVYEAFGQVSSVRPDPRCP